MTTERWNDDWLDRLADAVETNTANIAGLTDAVEADTTNIVRLADIAQLHIQNFDILIQEIRGLRAENRRILSHLFGEQSE